MGSIETGNEEQEYSVLRPWVQEVKYRDGRDPVYEPLFDLKDKENFHQPCFSTGVATRHGIEVEPSPLLFTEQFFPDDLIDKIAEYTNAYAKARLPPSQVQDVTRAELLRFFAIYYYMGLVKLPHKRDYWKCADDIWPSHPPCTSMTRKRFEYIWRNLHLVASTSEDAEEADVDEDDDDEFPALDFDIEDEEDNNSDVQPHTRTQDNLNEDTRWYAKADLFLSHVRRVSQRICIRPGTILSIDEMMKLFKGRSAQTIRIKCKPIKEGFKFFAICDVETGFVWEMIPDGRLEKETIHDTVLTLVSSIPDPLGQRNYVVGMDNYFTRDKVMNTLTELRIGVVGTSRFEAGWPPQEYRDIKESRFNSLHLMKDKHKYLIARWVDNNVVTMVTNVHEGTESVKRLRRKPRCTATNRRHLEQVWGDVYTKEIAIPQIIDDYNHWMLGVDKADQLIAYYRPKLRCRRTWMPLLFHALDVVRVNSYIAAVKCGYKGKLHSDNKSVHKEYTVAFVRALLARATTCEIRISRRRYNPNATPSPPPKRYRMSPKNPSLPDERFLGDPIEHLRVDAPKQGKCRMCSYLYFKAKKNGVTPLPTVQRPKKMCHACRVHLCTEHFHRYHRERT